MTRVLVCGGRDFSSEQWLREVLDGEHKAAPITCLIEGGAPGADRFARRWANDHGVPVLTFEANWKLHGRGAGPRRNGEMLTRGAPDLVIALPGGKGTADMVAQARRAGVPVREIVE